MLPRGCRPAAMAWGRDDEQVAVETSSPSNWRCCQPGSRAADTAPSHDQRRGKWSLSSFQSTSSYQTTVSASRSAISSTRWIPGRVCGAPRVEQHAADAVPLAGRWSAIVGLKTEVTRARLLPQVIDVGVEVALKLTDVATEVRPHTVLGERIPVCALDLDDDGRYLATARQHKQVDTPAPGTAERDRPLRGRVCAEQAGEKRRLHAGMEEPAGALEQLGARLPSGRPAVEWLRVDHPPQRLPSAR